MKHNLRKFLSLLMVFAMLCGMIPAAMAAKVPSYIYYEEDDHGDYELILDFDDNLYSDGTYDVDDDNFWVEVEATVYDGNSDITDECCIYFDWLGDYDKKYEYDDYSYAYLDTHYDWCFVECEISVEYDDDEILEGWVEWDLYADDYYNYNDILIETTVYNTSEGYRFYEEDDEGYDSVEDQIYDAFYDIIDEGDYFLDYIVFHSDNEDGGELSAYEDEPYYSYNYDEDDYDLLSDIVFYPEEDFEGEVEFEFTAYYEEIDGNDKDYIYGTLVFNVINDQSTGMDILYTAESGEEVLLDEDDLEDFWYEAYPKGELEYVKFTRVSDGYLYDNYEGGSKKWTDVEGSTKCYWDPSSKQIGLDDLTYVPGKNTVSATISFTAHGTTGSGSRTADVSGAITILYVDGDVAPIEYDVEDDDAITLDAADFTALYKDVMGVKSAGTLQIQFMEVPENGILYMNYSVSKSGKVSGTKLTGSNIDGYMFSSSTNASRSIEDVSYVPDSDLSGDSITFACYSSNQLKFIGTIDFNAAVPVEISLTCTAKGGLFKTTDFFNSGNSTLKNAHYILFGTPSSGTLYRNSTGGISTKVTVNDKFTTYTNTAYGYYSLNELAFMPSAVGLVEIPFVAVLLTGSYVNGTVKITVSPAVFSDVSTGAYYYNAVQWAVLNEVTTGTGDGSTFSPNMTCDRGQVVTFLWRSKGCPEPKTTTNPFVDVKSTDYYYKAVLWAVEQGITTGTSGNTFSPSKTCTSGEVVTFLWRANGKPAATHVGTQFYAEAVAWATAKNLLSGTGTAFVATANCPRADIVTYMYRAEN